MEKRVFISKFNKSIARIEEKCTLCGTCYKTCLENNNIKNDCINCGSCLVKCPFGSITTKFSYKKVINYLKDTDYLLSISIAPSVRVAIGDLFSFPYGTDLEKKLVALLHKIGFNYVFDVSFGADLVSVNEANEFLERIKDNKNLPLITSCCPSSVLYMEKYHYDDINLLSTCKSPVSMQISIIKNYFTKYSNISNDRLINVLVVPCVSKKSENEIFKDQYDFVITTSELSLLIKELGLDFNNLDDEEFDSLLGLSSNLGLSFGSSSGVLNSVVNSCYYIINKEAPTNNLLKPINKDNHLEGEILLNDRTIKYAIVGSINNFEDILKHKNDYDIIEVMACTHGCINGAGQPLIPFKDINSAIEKRKKSILNNKHSIKNPLINEEINELYKCFLTPKLCDKLLHRNYEKKDSIY